MKSPPETLIIQFNFFDILFFSNFRKLRVPRLKNLRSMNYAPAADRRLVKKIRLNVSHSRDFQPISKTAPNLSRLDTSLKIGMAHFFRAKFQNVPCLKRPPENQKM